MSRTRGHDDPEKAARLRDMMAKAQASRKGCVCGGAGFFNMARWEGEEVNPGHPLFGVAIPCKCKIDQGAKLRAQRLRAASGIHETEFTRWQFANFLPDQCVTPAGANRAEILATMHSAKQCCEHYAEHPEGTLILQGPVGCGKTHLAYAIAGRRITLGEPAYGHTVPGLLDELRASLDDGTYDLLMQDLHEVGLLVLDDLGSQRDTSWVTERLYDLINFRYSRRLPLVVTTNLDLAEPSPLLDERIRSRLQEGAETENGYTRMLCLPAGDFRPRAKLR